MHVSMLSMRSMYACKHAKNAQHAMYVCTVCMYVCTVCMYVCTVHPHKQSRAVSEVSCVHAQKQLVPLLLSTDADRYSLSVTIYVPIRAVVCCLCGVMRTYTGAAFAAAQRRRSPVRPLRAGPCAQGNFCVFQVRRPFGGRFAAAARPQNGRKTGPRERESGLSPRTCASGAESPDSASGAETLRVRVRRTEILSGGPCA